MSTRLLFQEPIERVHLRVLPSTIVLDINGSEGGSVALFLPDLSCVEVLLADIASELRRVYNDKARESSDRIGSIVQSATPGDTPADQLSDRPGTESEDDPGTYSPTDEDLLEVRDEAE